MWKLKFGVAAGVALLATTGFALAQGPAFWPKGAQLYFLAPTDGAVVSSPVEVKFGLKGVGVAPAGVDKAATGHHHLLVDVGLPENLEESISADANHIHFGGGQTEAPVKLTPGKHTLQLILGDQNHIPHNPPLVSKKITITVNP
jgi:hypothetical protein